MRIIFKYDYRCKLTIITPCMFIYEVHEEMIKRLKDKLNVKSLPDPAIAEGWICGVFFMGQLKDEEVYLSEAWTGDGREIEIRDVHADKLGVKLITEIER